MARFSLIAVFFIGDFGIFYGLDRASASWFVTVLGACAWAALFIWMWLLNRPSEDRWFRRTQQPRQPSNTHSNAPRLMGTFLELLTNQSWLEGKEGAKNVEIEMCADGAHLFDSDEYDARFSRTKGNRILMFWEGAAGNVAVTARGMGSIHG
jgi:hypothetical protein